MGNKFYISILLTAGIVSSVISAIFMSSTLYALAPAGWMSVVAVFMGLILEAFKSGFSRVASDFYNNKKYLGFAVSILFVGVALSFAVWAGQERFVHDLAADAKRGDALQDVRLVQIKAALQANQVELRALADRVDVVADTTTEKRRAADLYEQSKAMRDRMGYTKAGQLESTSIEQILAEIRRKESEADQVNAAARKHQLEREAEIREQTEALQAEQIEIASRTGKLVTTDLASAGLILKAIILLLETAPIFLFFMHGLKSSGFNPQLNPLENRGLQPSDGHDKDSILRALREAGSTNRDSIPDKPRSQAVAFQSQEPVLTPDAGMAHPKLDAGIEYVSSLEPGTKISTLDFKTAVAVGSDHVATILSQIRDDHGLVTKTGRSWIRV